MYLGKMVPIEGFRAFVYGAKGESRICDSWKERESLTSTGEWFDEKPAKKEKKTKKGKS